MTRSQIGFRLGAGDHPTTTQTDTDTDTRATVFIVAALTGERRAAGALIRAAIRAVVGDRRPAFYSCVACGGREARYVVNTTASEFAAILCEIDRQALIGRWSGAPVDAYRD